MKKRNIIWVSLAAILILGVLGLGGIGCPATTPAVSITDVNGRLVAVEQWKAEFISVFPNYPNRTEVNSMIASAVTNVNAPNLSGYATDAELQAALDSFIANLTPAQITALKQKLAIAGGGGSDGTDPEDAVKCTTPQFSGSWTFPTGAPKLLPSGGNSYQPDIPFTLKLTNKLAADIENVALSATITLYPDYPLTTDLQVSGDTLTGDIQWQRGWAVGSFTSWGQEELDASDSETFVLHYRPIFTNKSTTELILEGKIVTVVVHVVCTDYDIK